MFTVKNIFLISFIIAFIGIFNYSSPGVEGKSDEEKNEAAKECYNLGLDALKGKDYRKAILLFNKAISYNEDFAEVYAKLGDAYEMLKEDESAYENYKNCIEIINKEEEPSEEMIKLKKEILRKTEKFRTLEEKIAGLDKEFVSSLMKLGEKCMNEKDYALAEDIFSLVLQIEMDNPDASEYLQKAKEELAEEND